MNSSSFSHNWLTTLELKNQTLAQKFISIRESAIPILNRISTLFPSFTPHDISHSDSLLNILWWLIPERTRENLNSYEIFVLLSSCCLHDIGMACEGEWRKQIEESELFKSFKNKCKGTGNETEILASFVRENHHLLSARFIEEHQNGAAGLCINDSALARIIARLCESHCSRDLNNYTKYPLAWPIGSEGISINLPCLGIYLRLADLLDITSKRTPLILHKFISPAGISEEHWNKHLSIDGITPFPETKSIVIRGNCKDPDIDRAIADYIQSVNTELQWCHEILRSLPGELKPRYCLDYYDFKGHIETEGFRRIHVHFELENARLLKTILGENLYSSKSAAIRELLRNAVDTCRLQKTKEPSYSPKIRVDLNSEKNLLTIEDNGEGMNEDILISYFARIGRSFYDPDEYRENTGENLPIIPLSGFGIGILSTFMIADRIDVETKKKDNDALKLEIRDPISHFIVRESNKTSTGTLITLYLKEDILKDISSLSELIRSQCLHVEIPIEVTVDSKKIIIQDESYEFDLEKNFNPFFKDDLKKYKLHSRKINKEDSSGICGALGFFFKLDERFGIIPSGPPPHWMLVSHKFDRRILSQLGFKLPEIRDLADPDYLFTSLNLSSFVFDLNFEGTLQFDLSTSRESVLINQKAHATLAALDKLLVDYFKNIINTFWKELGEEDLSFLFSEVINRHISVQRLTNLGGFFRLSPALELINMLHQYVKFECIVNKITKKLTWHEIVASGKALILCHPKTLESQKDERLSALDSLLPDTIFLVGSPIEPFPIQLLSRSTQELAIVILSKYNLAYTVLKPYDVVAFKNGTELRKGGILQPFITDGPRYISINIAKFKFHSVMTGEFFRINAIHPFISKLIEYGGNFPEGSAEWWEFIRFIQEFRSIDEKINDAELNWIRARQLSILGKMLTAGKISQEDSNSLMIQIDDFPEWERPKLV